MAQSVTIGVFTAVLFVVTAGAFPLMALTMMSGVLSAPKRFRLVGMIGLGLSFDAMSGHVFGLGVLLGIAGSVAISHAESIFRPSPAIRVSLVLAAIAGILAALAILRVVTEPVDLVAAAAASWTPTGMTAVFVGGMLAFAVLLATRRETAYRAAP